MEALFIKDTSNLFGCDSAVSKPFYCPTTPHRPNTTNKVGVLIPSSPTHRGCSAASLHRATVKQMPYSDLHWELRSPQTDGRAAAANDSASLTPSTTHTDSPTYDESWPSCSEQTSLITNSQRSCDKGVPLERALLFEKEGRPSLARFVERFRNAPPTSREERGRELLGESTPFQPPLDQSSPQTSDGTSSAVHTNNSPSSADPSPRVSDNSLDSRSQGLINRGSSLTSSSSTTASSLPANNYFNSKREPKFRFQEAIAPSEQVLNYDGVPSSLTNRCGRGTVSHEEDILYQWRLRRRLEEARREVRFVSEQASRQFQPPPSHTVATLHQNRDKACHITHSDDQATKDTHTRIASWNGHVNNGSTGDKTTLEGSLKIGVPGIGFGRDSTGVRKASVIRTRLGGGKDVHAPTTRIAGCEENILASTKTTRTLGNRTTLGGVETRVPDMGTESAINGMGTRTGLGGGMVHVEPTLDPYPLAQAAVHGGRENSNETSTELGGDKHGGLKSPSSTPRVNEKDHIAQTDPTFTGKEEERAYKELTSTDTENISPLPLSEQGEGLAATHNHDIIPPPSKQPEAWSPSSHSEKEPEAAVNQSVTSESTLTSVTQLSQPTTVIQAHTPRLQEDKCHGNNCSDLEQGAGVDESSYWTITPCESPDSGQTHSLGPLLNEVVGDRLFDHPSSAPPTPSKTTHGMPDSGDIAVVLGQPCPVSDVVSPGGPSWEDDMNDDLLRLLISKAHSFEAGIRRIDCLLDQL